MSSTPLVECIPNFSEGRRPEILEALAHAIRAHDVHLLDYSADPDHHRSVFTFIGSPAAVEDAMFAATQVAIKHIDLEQHVGVHPRTGAVDVVPFVPLHGCTLADCVALAHRFGERVARDLQLPVYYYEAAALHPERTALPNLRRGGYETLKTAIENDPLFQPDVGPKSLSNAGAIIIGARLPLIAFNVYLNTDDVEIARAIAGAIRERDGGIPGLRALGLLVGGRAQVSMNILDYQRAPLHTIMQAIDEQAARYGASVDETELVGLIPQAALLNYAFDALKLPNAARAQVLETRIGQATGNYQPLAFE